jgi:hypothetical protein
MNFENKVEFLIIYDIILLKVAEGKLEIKNCSDLKISGIRSDISLDLVS